LTASLLVRSPAGPIATEAWNTKKWLSRGLGRGEEVGSAGGEVGTAGNGDGLGDALGVDALDEEVLDDGGSGVVAVEAEEPVLVVVDVVDVEVVFSFALFGTEVKCCRNGFLLLNCSTMDDPGGRANLLLSGSPVSRFLALFGDRQRGL
jgi:hypothetical protein